MALRDCHYIKNSTLLKTRAFMFTFHPLNEQRLFKRQSSTLANLPERNLAGCASGFISKNSA
jgi:hypothetical protein